MVYMMRRGRKIDEVDGNDDDDSLSGVEEFVWVFAHIINP